MRRENKSLNVSLLLRSVLCLLVLAGFAAAQNVSEVTTNTTDGSSTTAASQTDDDNAGDFDVTSSVELGYRGRKLRGDENKYRSDLNYGTGVRLFDSTFLVKAKDGTGKPFDTLLVTGTGWNADPNGYTRISVDKIGIYNFDGSVRRMTYFNNLSNLALGLHTRNNKRNIGDFDVTLLPQNEVIKFRVGYSFNTQDGPGLTSFDYDRDEFPILSNFKSHADDFRFGADIRVLGFNLSFTESYRRFDDDTSYRIDVPQLGNNPNPNSSFATFSRTMPETGKVYSHQFSVSRMIKDKLDFTGRFIYSESKSKFSLVDMLTGLDRSGNTINLDQSNIDGEGKRPHFVGDIGLTFFATDKFSISNSFSVNSYRITGANVLLQSLMRTNAGGTPLPTSITNTAVYRFTNFRRFINTIEGDYDINRYASFYIGYRYTNRRVLLDGVDQNLVNQSSSLFAEEAENTTNSVIGGLKVRPILKKWTMYFDVEHGQADNVFTKLSNYDTTNVKFRNIIKPTDDFSMNVSFQVRNNTNPSKTETIPVTNFGAEVKSRVFAASFNYNPMDQFALSGGYSHNRLDSETAVIFPAGGPAGQGFSRYSLRSNFFNIDSWFKPHKRFSGFVSYRISKDTGNGDFFSASDFLIESSYPMSFQSPEGRLTFRINDFIDWNVGYQYYKYTENVAASQNYRAHLPYTSLRIYLGRKDR